MNIWLDTNRCPETWHSFRLDDKGFIQAFHISDDRPCDEVEFELSRDDLMTLAQRPEAE